MVVQHNLTAMNSNRMLGITTGRQAKSTEKLSSGYKINRAADDAAGLTISEKMRKQMRGLDRASTNAEDGVSAVQTAEGALTEVHDMLQRMNELAIQSANGTNSETDRDAIQAEVDQLVTEIDRVSETTKFNETYLLKGNADGATTTKQLNAHDAGLAGKLTDNGASATFKLNKPLESGDKVTIAGKEYTISGGSKVGSTGAVLDRVDMNASTDGYAVKGATTFTQSDMSAGDSVTYQGKTYTLSDKIGLDQLTFKDGDVVKVGDVSFTIEDGTASASISADSPLVGKIGLSNVESYIRDALANGQKVVTVSGAEAMQAKTGTTGDASAAVTAGTQIVEKLADGEVSAFQAGATTVGGTAKAELVVKMGAGVGAHDITAEEQYKFQAGDSITLDGKTTVATEKDPAAARDVYDAIKALDDDGTKKVKIGDGVNAIEYTIVDEDNVDEEGFKLTKDMILAKITDGTTVKVDTGNEQTVIGDIGNASNGVTGDTISASDAYKLMAAELEKASSIGADEGKGAVVANKGDGSFTIKKATAEIKDALSFTLHVGADADMTNKIGVDIDSMSAAGLGIKGIKVDGNDVANATYAVDAIADAIQQVSSQRSALGAIQNRLEHTIANLDNVVENTTAAESRIRDTDMAEEMVEYSKNNILAQAGQSMLAQANQSNQGVLSLLG